MRIHDSFSREPVELPAPPGKIRLYVCGVTPYDVPHLGHARAAVVFDAFTRWLRRRGNEVVYIRNITDIDDKIIDRSAALRDAGANGDWRALVERCIDEYTRMTTTLGCAPPDREPRVTEHVPQIIDLIQTLVAGGHAYASGGSVYFAVRTFEPYGRLSGRRVDELVAGAAEAAGDDKKDLLDFALWKAAKPGEPSWDSPWGPGRPGWHIECSAMALHYLGSGFEIHGGGNDLIFPHHENEIAQSEAATGERFTKIWMHNGLITLQDRKMSKSEGNTLQPSDLAARHGAATLRFYLLNAHYRSPIDFHEDRLRDAKSALERFATLIVSDDKPVATESTRRIGEDFRAALEDDFNTARALGVLFEAVKEANKSDQAARDAAAAAIRECGEILGLDLIPARSADAEIDRLVEERLAAKRARDFSRADAIRKALSERGFILEDSAQGTRWRRS
jgi:cysteinyl-tRNA synthetase